MDIREPAHRYVTHVASYALIARLGWSFETWMQDWPLEISNEIVLGDCLDEYERLQDDDEKFLLMKAMLYALDEEENDAEFGLRQDQVSKFLNQDFDIHKSTIYYWTQYGSPEFEDTFRITPFMRKIWNDR